MEIKRLISFLSFVNLTLCCVYFQGPNGLLQGRKVAIQNTPDTFYAFHEMPYAQPPIKDLRFQPPQPITNWTGIRDATKNTKICHQIGISSPQESEDCLYLNVYTPQLPSSETKEGLPVMVYFHGGGFILGDGTYEYYGPHNFIQYGVIIVTLNYRLGVYGFLSTQDEVIPGNNGLKDQLLALQWVNQHISIFGGDPNKVTIFGQSAGAASVGYHLLNPKSKGLYRAAIMESGSPLSPWAYQRDAKTYAFKLAENLKADVKTSADLLAVLKAAEVEAINKAADEIIKGETYDNVQLFQGFYFAPTIEPASTHAFLTEKMYQVLADGKANNVPIIIGINSEEALSSTTTIESLKTLLEKYDNDLPALIPKDMNSDPTIGEDIGELIRKIYVSTSLLVEKPELGLRYISDTAFTRSVIKHAALQSTYSDVFFYQFGYHGLLGNITLNINVDDNVGHNEEVAYLWKTRCDLVGIPQDDLDTRKRLLLLWTNFAKTMNPTPNDFDEDLLNKHWVKFEADTSYTYLSIEEMLHDDYNPKKLSAPAWDVLYEAYGQPPFDTY